MSVCLSVCLSVCEYMDLVLGGDCFECANKFVYQLARWLVVRLPVKCTTLPLPLPLQDPAKAKHFLPFLQRAGKTAALVEVWRAWWVGQGVGVAHTSLLLPLCPVCGQWVTLQAVPAQGHVLGQLPPGRSELPSSWSDFAVRGEHPRGTLG